MAEEIELKKERLLKDYLINCFTKQKEFLALFEREYGNDANFEEDTTPKEDQKGIVKELFDHVWRSFYQYLTENEDDLNIGQQPIPIPSTNTGVNFFCQFSFFVLFNHKQFRPNNSMIPSSFFFWRTFISTPI